MVKQHIVVTLPLGWEPDPIELAWAAGFFDGEGCVCTMTCNKPNGKTYRKMSLQITQIDTEVLHRFRSAVGGIGKLSGPYTPKSVTRTIKDSPCWRYSVASYQGILLVTALLWPYLCGQKKEQAKAAIAKYENWKG